LQRTARETLKQSGSLHALAIHAALPLAATHAAFAGLQVRLDPYSPAKLSHCLQAQPSTGGLWAIRLWAGPEAGFTSSECELLDSFGCQRACIAPYVLRIETALEAAAAIAIECYP
jgi:16S rRNA U1498 N3-methylase RsmE